VTGGKHEFTVTRGIHAHGAGPRVRGVPAPSPSAVHPGSSLTSHRGPAKRHPASERNRMWGERDRRHAPGQAREVSQPRGE
jgi:hypothetical protein